MPIVISDFTKSAQLLWNNSDTNTVFVYIHLYGTGDAQGRHRSEWYLYVFFLSLVAVVSRQDETEGKRSTERVREFEERTRDGARRSKGWSKWRARCLRGQTKVFVGGSSGMLEGLSNRLLQVV